MEALRVQTLSRYDSHVYLFMSVFRINNRHLELRCGDHRHRYEVPSIFLKQMFIYHDQAFDDPPRPVDFNTYLTIMLFYIVVYQYFNVVRTWQRS